jgi:hypothetical protein
MSVGRKNLSVVLLVVALVTSLAAPAAAQGSPAWASEMYDDFSEMTPKYNEQVGELNLGLGNGLLEDQRVTVRVTDGPEVAYYWFETDQRKRIVASGEGKHPDGATLVVKTSRTTLTAIAISDTPVASFRDAVRDDRLTFSGKTPTTFVVGLGVSIGQKLGLFG